LGFFALRFLFDESWQMMRPYSTRLQPYVARRPFCKPSLYAFLLLATAESILGCSGKKSSPPAETKQPAAKVLPESPVSETPKNASLALPVNFDRHTGDLDGMLKRRRIRALVVYSRSGFFYDKGHPKGISYEAVEEFQRFLNKKLKTGPLKVSVTFVPARPQLLEAALTGGVGDFIATGVVVMPERAQRVSFTVPIAEHANQIVVTGPTGPELKRLEDLSGKEVYANPLTNYYENLEKLSESFQKAGKPPILVRAADKNLTDEDLLEMVNAGLIPATVTFTQRAEFWSKVFPHLTVHPHLVLASEGQLAWVTRKDSPKLNEILDEFIQGHRLGTSFGNTLFRRYLQNTKWVTDSTSRAEMKKFQNYVVLFKKYASKYDFDYLMLAAQGYQESMLDQNRRSPRGAVGIMQIIPRYASAPPISIPRVSDADDNIHAGAKMLHNIELKYFNDPGLDLTNKTLFTFAASTRGPAASASCERRRRLKASTQTNGLAMSNWLSPKPSAKKPFSTSAISISTTWLTS
jgi:membrane-bound lytic murein transglycosylase MltF